MANKTEGMTRKENTEEQILTMYEKASIFITHKPWKYLSEDQIFIVSKQVEDVLDGQFAFCHVTGQTEDIYSVSLYVGEEGYQSALAVYQTGEEDDTGIKYMNELVRRQCLTISFELYENLYDWEKEIYSFVRVMFDPKVTLCPRIKYQKSEGYPTNVMDYDLCAFFIEALGGIEALLLNKVKRHEVSHFFDEQYLVVTRDSQTEYVKSSCFTNKPKVEDVHFLNDLLVHRVKKLPKIPMTIQVIQFYLPNPVIFNEEEEEAKYARVYGFVESQEGQILCIYVQEDEVFNPQDMLTTVAKECLSYEIRPDYFVTSDVAVYEMIKDFCLKINVGIELVEETDVAEEFAEEVYGDILHESKEADEQETQTQENDEELESEEGIILFIEHIYTQIKDYDLLSRLSAGGRNYYKQILTIFAVEMFKAGSHDPLNWDPVIATNVIQTKLKIAVGIRMWVYAKEVIEHYVVILGEDGAYKNYKAFFKTLEIAFS